MVETDQDAMTEISESRTEAQIIASILAGNTHEFHDLIRPHERSVYVMALSLLHNEADAEDVTQEAFLKAFRNLANFRGDSKFSTWLISITLNEARSRLRSRKNVKIESLDESPEGRGSVTPALLRDWREIPSEALERQEVRGLLQQAITDLPLIYREVFLLRDVEELSVNESAEALGISVASVKVRLHRARIMMQKKLVPQLRKANPKRRWFPWS
jgi:RNA polymerase sigma-70 factor (ECF subfamily)